MLILMGQYKTYARDRGCGCGRVKEDADFNGTIGNMSRDSGCGCARDPDTLG